MTTENILLKIEYDGTSYSGWQRQPHHQTIQASIEDILRKFTGKKVVLYGASRTDSGVHAKGQMANFEIEPKMSAERWAPFLNSALPQSIRVLESKKVPNDFHAQKMAASKIYEYKIQQRSCPSALDKTVQFYPLKLDWNSIRASMPHFLGEHDFKAFQGARASVVTTVRTIYRFELVEEEEGLYRFIIEGNGFLKQMVRSIVGTLLEVGAGKKKPEDIPRIIASGDRRMAGFTAEARGLCLVKVNYPTPFH